MLPLDAHRSPKLVFEQGIFKSGLSFKDKKKTKKQHQQALFNLKKTKFKLPWHERKSLESSE